MEMTDKELNMVFLESYNFYNKKGFIKQSVIKEDLDYFFYHYISVNNFNFIKKYFDSKNEFVEINLIKDGENFKTFIFQFIILNKLQNKFKNILNEDFIDNFKEQQRVYNFIKDNFSFNRDKKEIEEYKKELFKKLENIFSVKLEEYNKEIENKQKEKKLKESFSKNNEKYKDKIQEMNKDLFL